MCGTGVVCIKANNLSRAENREKLVSLDGILVNL